MTAADIVDFLEDNVQDMDGRVFVGTIDGNLTRCVGVYDRQTSGPQQICLGGKDCTKTLIKQFRILVHWSENPTEAAHKSHEIHNLFFGLRRRYVGNSKVYFADPDADVIPVGRTQKGIYEYVIDLSFYLER